MGFLFFLLILEDIVIPKAEQVINLAPKAKVFVLKPSKLVISFDVPNGSFCKLFSAVLGCFIDGIQ